MSNKPLAFITGAGRGIGRGIAIELAKNGFNIAGNDIIFDPNNKDTGLYEVKEKIEKLGVNFLPVPGDISSLENHQKMLNLILDNFGKIDLLVNNAGVAPLKRMDILETTTESYDRVLSINTRGPFFLTQLFAKQMIKQLKENVEYKPIIIFISSISAYVSSPSRAEYCISKSAISHIARMFADRLSELGINVYEIRPGIIQTDMTAPVKEKYDKLISEGLVPQKRWGFPEDVGKAVVAIAKGYFSFSTGMIVEVSGGMNIKRL